MPKKYSKQALRELYLIKDMIKDLDPPVYAFEDLIMQSKYRILISVLLSSRTKDTTTGPASKRLFKVADTPFKMSNLSEKEIEKLIYPVGFYRQKAKNIKNIADLLKDENNIPDSNEGLETLPGVGRKTANLVMSLAYDIPRITVDIHVFRISQRLAWAQSEDYEKIEKQLEKLFDKNTWTDVNRTLVGFGQTLCKPLKPICSRCELTKQCLYFKTKKA
jgi:endonuclease III